MSFLTPSSVQIFSYRMTEVKILFYSGSKGIVKQNYFLNPLLMNNPGLL